MIGFTTTEPNGPVRIYQGAFDLRGVSKENSVPAKGSITIRWLPEPRLEFQSQELPLEPLVFDVIRSPEIVDVEGTFICETTGSLRLQVGKEGPTLERSERLFLELELSRFERTCDSTLDHVLFHVANLTGLHKRTSEGSGLSNVNRISIVGGGWRIQLDATTVSDRRLRDSGGFALTHTGLLEREAKKPFTIEEAVEMLDGLYYFLSFVRGEWCWPCLYVGTFASKFCWFHCAKPREIDQMMGLSADPFRFTGDEQVMATSFDGFLDFWSDIEWRNPIRTALSWYVEANR